MRYLLWHGVAESARRHPDRPAVQDAATTISYRELHERSERVAAFLAEYGVERGDRVALFTPKAATTVVAMLGALRAGSTYVPIDPSAPALRAAHITGDAGARVLVASGRLFESVRSLLASLPHLEHVVIVDQEVPAPPRAGETFTTHGWKSVLSCSAPAPEPRSIEDDPAYILYTSGSTGTPKGVVISHRNALAFVDWAVETFALEPEDRLSNHAPFHFDLSVFDLYGALHAGAVVLLIPDRVAPFPRELAAWMHEQEISVWYSVPSALVRLLKQGALERFSFPRLRTILFAGEVFPMRHLRDVMGCFRGAKFYNLYGPTETNVCTWYEVPRPLDEAAGELPIGVACANFDAFAITDSRQRARPGEEGELVVRGPGVMRGYWGMPERTAQQLAQNPLHADFIDPIYRTGDIVRVREDGGFDFCGRRDHMVKTRGYRVELGEIESVMLQYAHVRAAVVVALPDEDVGVRLRGVIVSEEACEVNVEGLTRFCMERLPRYAVPEGFITMGDLPATSTGKIDRRLLAEMVQSGNYVPEVQPC